MDQYILGKIFELIIMKLELKHLVGQFYSPIKVYNTKSKETDIITAIDFEYKIISFLNYSENILLSDFNVFGFKLIFRPLSDLTKLGDEKIPINEHTINILIEEKYNLEYGIFSCYKNELTINLDGDPSCRYDMNKSIKFDAIEDIRNELMKGHYDIFNLIENGLAIDINTIK